MSVLRAVLLSVGLAACSNPTAAPAPTAAASGPSAAGPAPISFATPPAEGARARCPVMGQDFTVGKETQRSQNAGRHYAFCCPGCKAKFEAEPGKYAHN